MTPNIKWVTNTSGNWCNFEAVDLSNVKTFGVYLIWNTNKKAVRIGQGDVSKRLLAHRQDREILRHKADGLYVTLASVPAPSVDGVERYLYDQYNPLVGERAPDVYPIAVNLP